MPSRPCGPGVSCVYARKQALRTSLFPSSTAGTVSLPRRLGNSCLSLYFTTKQNGTGLGLMIVQRIVREHGGTIEVESDKDRGTTFRIKLPIHEKPARLLASSPEEVIAK